MYPWCQTGVMSKPARHFNNYNAVTTQFKKKRNVVFLPWNHWAVQRSLWSLRTDARHPEGWLLQGKESDKKQQKNKKTRSQTEAVSNRLLTCSWGETIVSPLPSSGPGGEGGSSLVMNFAVGYWQRCSSNRAQCGEFEGAKRNSDLGAPHGQFDFCSIWRIVLALQLPELFGYLLWATEVDTIQTPVMENPGIFGDSTAENMPLRFSHSLTAHENHQATKECFGIYDLQQGSLHQE